MDVNNTNTPQLVGMIEQLVQKIEKLQQKYEVSGDVEKITTALQKLSEAVEQLTAARREQLALNEKIEKLMATIDQVVLQHDGSTPNSAVTSLEETLQRIARQARTFGQVLEVIASSLQITVNSVGRLIKEGAAKEKTGGGGNEEEKESARSSDLGALLQPLTALVQSLVEEKMKRQPEQEKEEAT